MLILALCVGLAALVIWQLNRPLPGLSEGSALEDRFAELHAQARNELPIDQIRALTHELQKIKDIEHAMVAKGMAAAEAREIALKGAIVSLAGHIELNRRMPG